MLHAHVSPLGSEIVLHRGTLKTSLFRLFRAPIKKECVTMVERYTDQIIHMFVSEYTPRQICEELKLCKPDAREQQLHSNDIPPINALPSVDMVEEEEEQEEEEEKEEQAESTNKEEVKSVRMVAERCALNC